MRHQFRCNACNGTYFDAQLDGTPYQHVCGPLPPDKDGVEEERPNKRNENPAGVRTGRPRKIAAEGDGVTCLTDVRLQEPPWITTMRKPLKGEKDEDDA